MVLYLISILHQTFNGKDIKPIVWENYDGGDLLLNKETGFTLSSTKFKELANYKGKTIITTDGTSLLSADDKAGIAEIVTAAEYLIANPEIKHGRISIGFTPDEEIGRGADKFNVAHFQCRVGLYNGWWRNRRIGI